MKKMDFLSKYDTTISIVKNNDSFVYGYTKLGYPKFWKLYKERVLTKAELTYLSGTPKYVMENISIFYDTTPVVYEGDTSIAISAKYIAKVEYYDSLTTRLLHTDSTNIYDLLSKML